MRKLLLFILIIVLTPFLIITFFNKNEIIYKIKYGSINNKFVKVKRMKTKKVSTLPLEDYVIGVVAGETPATFNLEALKAQAVASRTYVLKRINKNNEYDVLDGTTNQVYIDLNQMKEKWKEKYEENYNKVKKAVLLTKGEVILYNNDLIDAMFFSTSNGYTENSEDVFSNELPYLKSVESSWDKDESPVFNSTKEVSKEEFLFNLGLEITNEINITNIELTKSGRVKSLKVNDKIFKGTQIRKIFNLRSTSFTIKILDNSLIFSVTGFGHGVGLSQYGANGLAKKGYNYEQILKHYYKNCEIKKVN